MALRVVSLPATDSAMTKKPNSSSVRPRPSVVRGEQLGDDVVARVVHALGGQLHRIRQHFVRRHLRIAGEIRIVRRGHLVRPLEELAAIALGDTQQFHDRFQRQLGGHLLDEVATALRNRFAHDAVGAVAHHVLERGHSSRGESARDDPPRERVRRRVLVDDHDPGHLDGFALGGRGQPDDRAVLIAREDVGVLRHRGDIGVLGHRPIAGSALHTGPRFGWLLDPRDGGGAPQRRELLVRDGDQVDVRIGEVKAGRSCHRYPS